MLLHAFSFHGELSQEGRASPRLWRRYQKKRFQGLHQALLYLFHDKNSISSWSSSNYEYIYNCFSFYVIFYGFEDSHSDSGSSMELTSSKIRHSGFIARTPARAAHCSALHSAFLEIDTCIFQAWFQQAPYPHFLISTGGRQRFSGQARSSSTVLPQGEFQDSGKQYPQTFGFLKF